MNRAEVSSTLKSEDDMINNNYKLWSHEMNDTIELTNIVLHIK